MTCERFRTSKLCLVGVGERRDSELLAGLIEALFLWQAFSFLAPHTLHRASKRFVRSYSCATPASLLAGGDFGWLLGVPVGAENACSPKSNAINVIHSIHRFGQCLSETKQSQNPAQGGERYILFQVWLWCRPQTCPWQFLPDNDDNERQGKPNVISPRGKLHTTSHDVGKKKLRSAYFFKTSLRRRDSCSSRGFQIRDELAIVDRFLERLGFLLQRQHD